MDAVVGRDLGAEIIENKSLFTEDISYSRGIAGNALSHLLLWQYSFNNNLSINTSDFAEGFYIISINGNIHQRFLVIR